MAAKEKSVTSVTEILDTIISSAKEGEMSALEEKVEPGKAEPLDVKEKGIAEVAGKAASDIDLDSPQLYLNRELTWLNFNKRVLHEAQDRRTLLGERVKFLSIVDSNLDEFFMKRIGGLKHLVAAGAHEPTIDGRTPQQQIDECRAVVLELQKGKHQTFLQLRRMLEKEGIQLPACYRDLNEEEQAAMREHFRTDIFPLITPQAMDPAHPFPFLSNLSLNLLVTLRHPGEEELLLARLKVPQGNGIPRFLRVGERDCFIPVEEVMGHNLDFLFPGMEVVSCELFRVTRNANTEQDEELADDLLDMIETELRDRKFSPMVRLEVTKNMTALHRGMLAAELGLDEESDVYFENTVLGMGDLMSLAGLGGPELHDVEHHPVENAKLHDSRNIFHIIRDVGPILLQHPYESFATSVERFVKEASTDPKVLAIKLTLYRTSADTRIIDYLVNAARNGKHVSVVVELKARFDEAANIRWANRLETVGINVTYGVVGLKTHSKVCLVVRRDYEGLRRYAHVGTGNYHAGTARLYSDLGVLTCDPEIGEGLTELFNYLTTGYKPKRNYGKLLPAPKVLKQSLLDKIKREIELHSEAQSGLIRLKTNALEDPDITRALYEASQAGVRVELVVRDTCRLRPGLAGISDNIRVISIVGQFLEHARIFHFHNGGADEYFIGSADLMKRNLESRVELVIPVEEAALQEDLDFILTSQLNDNRTAWDMQSDGSYRQRRPGRGNETLSAQQKFIEVAQRQYFSATRLRKRKPKGVARRRGGDGRR